MLETGTGEGKREARKGKDISTVYTRLVYLTDKCGPRACRGAVQNGGLYQSRTLANVGVRLKLEWKFGTCEMQPIKMTLASGTEAKEKQVVRNELA